MTYIFKDSQIKRFQITLISKILKHPEQEKNILKIDLDDYS